MKKSLALSIVFLISCKIPPIPIPSPQPTPSPVITPSPSPSPEPTPIPSPQPTPNPNPISWCIQPGGNYDLIPDGIVVPQEMIDINASIQELIPACDIGSRCLVPWPGQEFYRLVIEKLQLKGYCAGMQVQDGDKIAIGTVEINRTYHIFAWPTPPNTLGTVAWQFPPKGNNSEPVTTWRLTLSAEGCSAPIPPSLDRFILKIHNDCPGCPWITFDSTAQVHSKEYCANYWTDGRIYCATRGEGMSDRPACDRLVIGGTQLWFYTGTNGDSFHIMEGNPAMAQVTHGSVGVVRTCDSIGIVCQELGVNQ